MENREFENCSEISDHEENLQLAENDNVNDEIEDPNLYEIKRDLLKKTKIVKQTWSVQEIFQKIKRKELLLFPKYQRNEVWKPDKQTAFIESLLMDILVPPIYVVEIAGENRLEDSSYEVVDGKQRLTAINSFLKNEFALNKKYLEYYTDLYSEKTYSDIEDTNLEIANSLLSFVLDVYVITANSPEFTKYDIFSRLNKGSEKLKVNEIRRAIYRSHTLDQIDEFVYNYLGDQKSNLYTTYHSIFTKNDILRYEDYGRFYRSIAFFIQSKIDVTEPYVENYNSRPRDMINMVLQQIQSGNIKISNSDINLVLSKTIEILSTFANDSQRKTKVDYIIDASIPFIKENNFMNKISDLMNDKIFDETFNKSVATTTNVNNRLKIVHSKFRNQHNDE